MPGASSGDFRALAALILAGTVASSSDPSFKPGDAVIATSYDVGWRITAVTRRRRIPAAWLVKSAAGMTTFDAMSYGTAGFTAALAVHRMQHDGLSPDKAPVLVNGATGGVGMVAIEILAKLGYVVVAVTGKDEGRRSAEVHRCERGAGAGSLR